MLISIKISLKFFPKCPISNIPALLQIMAWRRPGANYYLNQCWPDSLTHICGTRGRCVLNKRRDGDLVVTVSAVALEPNSARASADTMLTTKLNASLLVSLFVFIETDAVINNHGQWHVMKSGGISIESPLYCAISSACRADMETN